MKGVFFSLFLFSIYSCNNELHIIMPEGPAGKSAYDLWVDGVENGSIDWPKGDTAMEYFYLYMQGKEGKKGEDGLSAYELWITEVSKGIDNPHYPGEEWDKNKTEIHDFWYYLTGADGKNGSTPVIGGNGNWWIEGIDTHVPARGKDGQNGQSGQSGQNGQSGQDGIDGLDGSVVTIVYGFWHIDGIDTGIPAFGQNGNDGTNGTDGTNGVNGASAYELWVIEVGKGLVNPRNPEENWPLDKTSVADFWDYLRGKDGKDGSDGLDGKDGEPGEPGMPGEDIVVMIGKYNVLAQYSHQEKSEFVRWEDGGVMYIVYDKSGNVAPGAKVKGMPGVSDPEKIYTADGDGKFILPKDDLPKNRSYFGSVVSVDLNSDEDISAPNTFVPAKIDVRVRITAKPLLYQARTLVNVLIERRLNTSLGWEKIPAYLGNLTQKLHVREEKNGSYITGLIGKEFMTGSIDQVLYVDMNRPVKQNKYINRTDIWDGEDHYMSIQLESYYGESPICENTVKVAPIQYLPVISELRRGNILDDEDGDLFMLYLSGKFDIDDIPIDYSLVFKDTYALNGTVYEIAVENESVVKANLALSAKFNFTDSGGNISSTSTNYTVSINQPTFKCDLPYVGSEVILECKNQYFLNLGMIGILQQNQIVPKAGTNFPTINIE